MTIAPPPVHELDWSLPSTYAATRVHHGYSTVELVDAGRPRPHYDWFEYVLAEYRDVRQAKLTRLAPGGFIGCHVDAGPYRRRIHVPLQTAGWWWDSQNGGVQITDATDVPHWLPHAVWNPTHLDRIHLVVDLDQPHGGPATGEFVRCPDSMVPGLVEHIGAAQ